MLAALSLPNREIVDAALTLLILKLNDTSGRMSATFCQGEYVPGPELWEVGIAGPCPVSGAGT
jgi:hypothetical protein